MPVDDVLRVAQEAPAIPYDIPGVELSHVGDLRSFGAFLKRYSLPEPALTQLAPIARCADPSRFDLTAQCAGLYAISLGLSYQLVDDHEMLRHGLVLYNALYAWSVSRQGKTHA